MRTHLLKLASCDAQNQPQRQLSQIIKIRTGRRLSECQLHFRAPLVSAVTAFQDVNILSSGEESSCWVTLLWSVVTRTCQADAVDDRSLSVEMCWRAILPHYADVFTCTTKQTQFCVRRNREHSRLFAFHKTGRECGFNHDSIGPVVSEGDVPGTLKSGSGKITGWLLSSFQWIK